MGELSFSPRWPRIFEINDERCNLSSIADLNFSEACLFISSTAQGVLHFVGQSLQCVNCDVIEWATIQPNTTVPILIKSAWPVLFEIRNSQSAFLYKHAGKFGERGVYQTNCTDLDCERLITVQDPDDSLFGIILLLILLLLLQLSWIGFNQLSTTNWFQRLVTKHDSANELENDLGSPSAFIDASVRNEMQLAVQKQKSRVKSLDVFRGICIVLMVFVNYGGGKYPIFEHATWNGLTIADVVFPSFMWIMGLSMALSMRSQLRSGVTRKRLALRCVQRGMKLILIGIILNSMGGNNNLATLRIPGVLQRLGVAYIVVSLMETYRMKLQSCQQPHRLSWLQDVADAWLQWILVLVLIAVHSALTFALPVPDCPTGYLGPGGIQDQGKYKNCTGGAAGYIDRVVFGVNHIYQHPTVRKFYYTEVPYDPEGLLGNLTAVLLVYFGVQAGRIMLTYSNAWSRIMRWMIWGLLAGLVGAVLCNFSKESGVIPVNKNLFSLSFVLVNSCLDFILLSVLYFIVDVKHIWAGSPFYFTGMNSLLIYILHGFTGHMLPWRWQPLGNSHIEVLFIDVWAVSLWIIISYVWFRKNFFYTVVINPSPEILARKTAKFMPVSRMPWIPTKVSKTKLEDSKFFKEMMVARQDKGRLGLQLHWLLNQIFPYYLPKQYHLMDCRALEEKAPEGWYWANASYYFMCSQAHGSLFLNKIYELLRYPNMDFKSAGLRPYIAAKTRKSYFEFNLDVCESADEILFNPWLILQLPYNASLLQQWLVAFNAELFIFAKEMVELYFMSQPAEFEPLVKELLKIYRDLKDHMIHMYADDLKGIIEMDAHCATAFCSDSRVKYFKTHIGKIVAMLRFINSRECKNMIKALKCMAWNGKNSTVNRYDAMQGIFRRGDLYFFMGPGDVDHVYSYKFWMKDDLGIPKFLKTHSHEKSVIFNPDIDLPYEREKWKSANELKKTDVLDFVNEQVVMAGKLNGASPEKIMLELKEMYIDDYELASHCFLMYQHFIETSSESKGVRDADLGVIYQLNTLFADVHVAVSQAALVEICEWAINSRGKLRVYKNIEIDGERVSMPVKIMLKNLRKISGDESWSFTNLLGMVRNECKKGKEVSKEHPVLESGIDKIVQNLEARIKNILLRMIEGQMEQFKGPKRLYAEMPAVQYILPCFVASLIEMDSDSSVSEEAKRQYLRLVNEMVKTYERCEYYESHKTRHHRVNLTTELLDVYGPITLIRTVNDDIDQVLPLVLNLLPRKIMNYLQLFFRKIFIYSVCHEGDDALEYSIKLTSFSWPLQLYFLLCRFRAALEAVSPEVFISANLTESHRYKAILFAALVQNLEIKLPQREDLWTRSVLVAAQKRWFGMDFHKAGIMACFEDTSVEQLIGVVLYTYLNNLKKATNWRKPQDYAFVKRFFLDPIQNTYFNMLEGDMWKVKLMTSRWLSTRDGKQDLSMITLEEAKNQYYSYQVVLASLTNDGKVPMAEPGQVTFCPIQHCRWCGKVEGVDVFILCDVCLENPDYPDRNYYCSHVCIEAMKEQHTEEHAQYCLLKLTI